jgi:hypothetical protein
MALNVCFHDRGRAVDWSKKAIYLDQEFYELLYRHYERRESRSLLKAMVAIGYEDEFIIAADQVEGALRDLERISDGVGAPHPQFHALGDVLREAATRKCGIAVAGDMYPDLSRR